MQMNPTLRRAIASDVAECGRICFEAFKTVGERHGFPNDFPSLEIATGAMTFLISHPGFYSTVAELDGRIVGSNFMDERSNIAGIGPISVDPKVQTRGVGRRLMEDTLERARARGFAGVRLSQVAYNNQSLCLYSKLGFRTRNPLSLMSGPPPKVKLAGYEVRSASEADIEACNRLCRAVQGNDRSVELGEAIRDKSATVVERLGRVTGYATAIGFLAHAVAETDEDMMALIGAADQITGPGILVPTRNHALFNWCLDHGLKLVQQMTYMTIGLYSEPAGAYLPSVLY
jgi:GNAT superfamily N-acetyltransferase